MDVTPCTPAQVHTRFEGLSCLHPQSRACCMLLAAALPLAVPTEPALGLGKTLHSPAVGVKLRANVTSHKPHPQSKVSTYLRLQFHAKLASAQNVRQSWALRVKLHAVLAISRTSFIPNPQSKTSYNPKPRGETSRNPSPQSRNPCNSSPQIKSSHNPSPQSKTSRNPGPSE